MVFLSIKGLPNLLFGVLCLPGDQSHPFAQPTINPLACCICWAGLLSRAVFPPWNEGPNFGSYSIIVLFRHMEETVRTKNRNHYSGCFNCLWPSHVVLVVKNPSANADDVKDIGLIPGSGRSPGGEHGNSLRYSCLENPMDRGAWWATVHGFA